MNVAYNKWIPVVTTSGLPELASLHEVLTEGGKFSDLAVRPHERVSVMRLLLCVAHAALDGPKDYDEWLEVPKRLPGAVDKYLNHWKDSFELFHKEKPWLQVAGISKSADGKVSQADTEEWTPVSKLNFSFATGNNTTLFDHSAVSNNRSIAISETLLSMLTFQCFSPGGLISQVYWNGTQSGKSSKDGPCVPASMVHAFMRGNDILKTLHLNLPSYNDVRFSYGDRKLGRPVWEMMPASLGSSETVQNATETYIGRLVPLTRLIHLHPSGNRMLMGDGLAYPPFTDGFPAEPTATVVIREKGGVEEPTILSFRPEKALWRELSAVVVRRKAEGAGGPLSLRAIQDGKGCDLVVAALARDQATIVDTIESVFHIPSKLCTSVGVVAYQEEVKSAEAMASRLGWAVETYREKIDGGWEGRLKSAGPSKGKLKTRLHSTATTHYWTAVEKNLPLLMDHIEAIGSEAAVPTREVWQKKLFSAACDAYRIACGQETPRQIRAFAEGWQKLTTTKKDNPEKSTNVTKEEEL
jgi:CRISPR system Cascade subunit CasA